MGTFSKNSRGGKRGTSSSSSYASWASTVGMLLFVAFCGCGVYMLTSSSSSPLLSTSQSAAAADHRSSRFVLKDSHPSIEESQIDESTTEENVKEAEQDETSTAQSGSGASEDDSSHNQNQKEVRGGIESQSQIEHDTENTVDEEQNHQQQSQEGSAQNEDHQQAEASSEQIQNTAGQQQQEDSSQNEDQQEEQKQSDEQIENNDQQESLEHNDESRQQKQLEKQMEEDRENENQPRLQQEEHESHAGTQIEELSKDTDSRPWETQAIHPQNDTEMQKEDDTNLRGHEWDLCNVVAGPDYIPCLDNEKAIKKLHSFRHFEHRERHCPDESPTCLVPLPKGYKRPVEWPMSRDKIWYNNVPRTKLAEVKGHQNWVKVDGEYLTFPGGGTQFIHGALHYIDFLQQWSIAEKILGGWNRDCIGGTFSGGPAFRLARVPTRHKQDHPRDCQLRSQRDIAWGKHTRVILDVGCGVASFGGYLFDRDVLAMSFAPKDEHEAQVQFALERGIPAISAVMGSQRLSFPSKVFDLIHCARCRVPWHAEGGMLLLELNRVLRPGGYFVWSATPVYQKLKEDWAPGPSPCSTIAKHLYFKIGLPLVQHLLALHSNAHPLQASNRRPLEFPQAIDLFHFCSVLDATVVLNATRSYAPLKPCMHRIPTDAAERGTKWPSVWPKRLTTPPYWLNSSEPGIYGKSAPRDFKADYDNWKQIVMNSYINDLGIVWSKFRNIMDMRAVYGG
ncbi:putative methyltransferase PMT27 [Platanthera guangdongensis]|uniref:Methyltransferase n=1 Tax=Platanthera guangdongensis TaxID=2320717 RepID=A0ABR2MMF5_9ASPA